MEKNNSQPKKTLPLGLVVGIGAVLLLVGFLTSFGFSLWKTRIAAPKTILPAKQSSGFKLFGQPQNQNQESNQASSSDELTECNQATLMKSLEGEVRITGKETAVVDGTPYQVCCMTGTNVNSDGTTTSKACSVIDKPEDVLIFDNVNNQYVLVFASVSKNGKQCSYSFDNTGKLEAKYCE